MGFAIPINSAKPIIDSMWNWGENYKRTIQ